MGMVARFVLRITAPPKILLARFMYSFQRQFCRRSEQELQRDLADSGISGASHVPKGPAENAAARVPELRVIEGVEELEAKL